MITYLKVKSKTETKSKHWCIHVSMQFNMRLLLAEISQRCSLVLSVSSVQTIKKLVSMTVTQLN